MSSLYFPISNKHPRVRLDLMKSVNMTNSICYGDNQTQTNVLMVLKISVKIVLVVVVVICLKMLQMHAAVGGRTDNERETHGTHTLTLM